MHEIDPDPRELRGPSSAPGGNPPDGSHRQDPDPAARRDRRRGRARGRAARPSARRSTPSSTAHGDLRERITQDGDLRRFVNVYVSRRGHPLPGRASRPRIIGRRRGDDPAGRRRWTLARLKPTSRSSILCGGRGTRCRSRRERDPEGAGRDRRPKPILWHVIRIYAAQGFERFLLPTGYLGEMVEEFVAARASWPERGRGRVRRHRPRHADRRARRARSPTASAAALLRHLRRRRRRHRPRRAARLPRASAARWRR